MPGAPATAVFYMPTWIGPALHEAMKKPRGARFPGRGCDDQAGGEVVRSTRGGEASPGILDPGEGLPEDSRGAGERRGFLFRRRPAIHDRIDPPRSSAEQDDQRSRRPLPPDARLPCA